MTEEKWQELIERVKGKFQGVSLSTEDLLVETSDGLTKQGTKDVLEFETEHGTFRIIRENKPVLLDKKMHFSHRQGDSARTEYIFSDSEMSHKIHVYKEDAGGTWMPLSADDIGFLQA